MRNWEVPVRFALFFLYASFGFTDELDGPVSEETSVNSFGVSPSLDRHTLIKTWMGNR